jgi:hypothetical protein
MIDRSVFDRARGFIQHAETHLLRGPDNIGAVREALVDLRYLLTDIERRLDPEERNRLEVLPGGRFR